MDFSNIKTTGNRAYDINLLNQINDELSYLPDKQRASVLATIIEESGGNPLAKNDTGAYHGLMQWGADRYRIKSEDVQEELKNQLAYLKETIHNTKDHRSWTHGGTGSGYKSLRDTYSDFNNSNLPMEKVYRGLSYGYVRPKGKEDSYNNRVKIAKTLYSQMPQIPDYLRTPSAFHQMRMDKIFGNKHDTGGSLKHKTWNELSMHERADIMRVAINNGITKLEDIKSKYKEFSEGGWLDEAKKTVRDAALGAAKFFGINKPYKDENFTRQYRQNLYNIVDPTSASPETIKEAIGRMMDAKRAMSEKEYPYERKYINPTADAAWAKRLGLSYNKKLLPENPDGSVRLTKELENEIPIDTNLLKNRINSNEKLLEYYDKIGGGPRDIKEAAKLGIRVDKTALDSLRHTYKTGEPVVLNEHSHNNRKWVNNGMVNIGITPLSVLHNYGVKYDKKNNEMKYFDLYDFNEFEDFVPGSPFRIKGSIKLKK